MWFAGCVGIIRAGGKSLKPLYKDNFTDLSARKVQASQLKSVKEILNHQEAVDLC